MIKMIELITYLVNGIYDKYTSVNGYFVVSDQWLAAPVVAD